MKTALGGLAVCVVALLACRSTGPSWERVGGNTIVVTCRGAAECYRGASSACPYGYDPIERSSRTTGAIANSHRIGNSVQTTVIPVHRDELVVQCKAPVFCENAHCPHGTRCTKSRRYPGRAVCAAR